MPAWLAWSAGWGSVGVTAATYARAERNGNIKTIRIRPVTTDPPPLLPHKAVVLAPTSRRPEALWRCARKGGGLLLPLPTCVGTVGGSRHLHPVASVNIRPKHHVLAFG